jgi:hypothetical protein
MQNLGQVRREKEVRDDDNTTANENVQKTCPVTLPGEEFHKVSHKSSFFAITNSLRTSVVVGNRELGECDEIKKPRLKV